MLSATILLTNASSPPGVIISTSAPVQIYVNVLHIDRKWLDEDERTALGWNSFATADREASSVLE